MAQTRSTRRAGPGIRLTAGSLAVFALGAVPGCIFVDRGLTTESLRIGLDHGQFAVAVCENVSFDAVLMETRVGGQPWQAFWEFVGGDHSVPAGGILSAETAGEYGLEGPTAEPDLAPPSEVAVSLRSEGPDWDAFFTVPEGGLSEGEWLRPDGSAGTSPCED